MRRMWWAIPTALATFATMSVAQVPPADYPALRAKGFSQADLKAVDTTQIGSNHVYYTAWLKCVAHGTQIMLMNGIGKVEAGTFGINGCQEEALALRASIDRTLGLAQATRVISLLETDVIVGLTGAAAQQAAQTGGSTQQIGEWYLTHCGAGTCVATTLLNNVVGPIFLINQNGNLALVVRTNFPQPNQGLPSPNRLAINHYPVPTEVADIPRSSRWKMGCG